MHKPTLVAAFVTDNDGDVGGNLFGRNVKEESKRLARFGVGSADFPRFSVINSAQDAKL